MTRYVRSGSTQKHKKMPGDPTPWAEYSKQNSLSMRKIRIKNRNKNNLFNVSKAQQNMTKKRQSVTTDEEKSSFCPDVLINKMNESHKLSSDAQLVDINIDTEKAFKESAPLIKINKYNCINTYNQGENMEDCIIKRPRTETFQEEINMEEKSNCTQKCFSTKAERRQFYMNRKCFKVNLSPDESKSSKNIASKQSRNKWKKPCYNCRKFGHLLADCPEKSSGSLDQAIGICFKCGAMDHTSYKCSKKVEGFPFAKCFICKEQGHISRDCPKNSHGVYIKGGQCNLCGNVNHLKKDCTSLKSKKESTVTVQTISERASVDADTINETVAKSKITKKPKIVKF